jgi:DNA-directed RNA polymerase specialized sigma54-like protein
MSLERRFEFLYPPLQQLQEHLRQELARNPFIDANHPKHRTENPDNRTEDEPTDSPPPASGPWPSCASSPNFRLQGTWGRASAHAESSERPHAPEALWLGDLPW